MANTINIVLQANKINIELQAIGLKGDPGTTDYNELENTPDLSLKADKVTGYSLVQDILIAEIHAPHSDDQDLSGKVDKISGKDLSTNDLTNALKSNYDTAYTHSQSAHAPSNAQKNSDILQSEIEAKLTGEITSHNHNSLIIAYAIAL